MVILEILGRYEVRYPEIKCIRDRSCKRYNPCTSSIYEWGSGWYYSKWSGTKSRLEIAEIQGSLIVFPQSSPLFIWENWYSGGSSLSRKSSSMQSQSKYILYEEVYHSYLYGTSDKGTSVVRRRRKGSEVRWVTIMPLYPLSLYLLSLIIPGGILTDKKETWRWHQSLYFIYLSMSVS